VLRRASLLPEPTKKATPAPTKSATEEVDTVEAVDPDTKAAARKENSKKKRGASKHRISSFRQSKQDAWKRFMSAVPAEPPVPYDESRGIILCGGGKVYFSSALAVIRVLRHHGCQLPIELWIGAGEEMPAGMERELEEEDVVVRSAVTNTPTPTVTRTVNPNPNH